MPDPVPAPADGAISLIIAGSRTVDPSDEDIETAVIDALFRWGIPLCADRGFRERIAEVICGKARGADRAGANWARKHRIPVHEEPVTDEDRQRWGVYVAPKFRNRRMALRASHAMVFWDGISGGTSDMVCRMVARGKPVIVIPTRKREGQRRRRRDRRG